MVAKLASVSVDLDEIPNYFQIHGLSAPGEANLHAVYDVALARLLSWADSQKIPLTLFAVGADLGRVQNAEALRAAREKGHEVANHTMNHRYNLVRLPKVEIAREVEHGAEAIRAAVGGRPVGFRAPGYTVVDDLFRMLSDSGFSYDSSVFPCPAYFAAKTGSIAWIGLSGRRSFSIVDTPLVLSAPTRPYRVGTPYWKKGFGLLEFPIQVTRTLRLPVIGTSLTLFGESAARRLSEGCLGEPFINLELHGIDVLDASDGLEPLRKHQPDVRVPQQDKLRSLSASVETWRRAGYAFVTLEEAARHWGKAA